MSTETSSILHLSIGIEADGSSRICDAFNLATNSIYIYSNSSVRSLRLFTNIHTMSKSDSISTVPRA